MKSLLINVSQKKCSRAPKTKSESSLSVGVPQTIVKKQDGRKVMTFV